MNLIQGKLLDKEASLSMLEAIEENILKVKSGGELHADTVIAACDRLADSLTEAEYLPLLRSLDMPDYKAARELATARKMLSRDYLKTRLRHEVGSLDPVAYTPIDTDFQVIHTYRPLGTLLHIVAGNVDALPVFSVIEGLLTGNINILKLPGADNGLSIRFLQKLIELEPILADYIFVFDYPSQEVESIKKMAAAADAIVIWGGDEAIRSVRQMAEPNTKIIEWGHKISFAYVSGDASDKDLEGIAYNICDTNQLFCSSCQGIYLDTDSYDELVAFAERFLPILEDAAKKMTLGMDSFLSAQKTLEFYAEQLEAIKMKKHVLKSDDCGIIVYEDSKLVPSYMYRHCWIKPLPKGRLLSVLSPYKNHLQTVGLVCPQNKRETFVSLLTKTGIVRISSPQDMSVNYCGMPHDGCYSLTEYMKVIAVSF